MKGHFLIFLVFFSLGCSLGSQYQPKVTIENGVVVGYYGTSRYGQVFQKFEGIPYAKPPVEGRRFKEAERLDHWIGEWNATSPGSACLQIDHYHRHRNENGDYVYHIEGDEDCLYLNVYTQEGGPKDKNVIVFVHGGAFMFGVSHYYGPEYLMEDNSIVYVTMNYRLGPLGFLTTGDSFVPGNNGLKDQTAALEWVQRNIAAFGGDPNKVTLAGLSAGGVSVHFHFLSPLSRGLFTKGYSYSGTTLAPWPIVTDGVQKTKKLATLLGCPTTDSKTIVKCLRRRPARKIVEQVGSFHSWMYNPFTVFGPVVEEGSNRPFIDKTPMEIIRSGEVQDLPWISGYTTEDGLYPAGDFVDDDRFLQQLNEKWETIAPTLAFYSQEPKKEIAKQLKELYLGQKDFSRETVPQIIQMYSDRLFIGPAIKAAVLQARANTYPVYLYQYSHKAEKSTSQLLSGTKSTFGACHGDDMAYVVRFYEYETHLNEGDKAMWKVLSEILLTFVETGAPPEKYNWEPVSKTATYSKIQYLHISSPDDIKMEEGTDVGNLKKWAKILDRKSATNEEL